MQVQSSVFWHISRVNRKIIIVPVSSAKSFAFRVDLTSNDTWIMQWFGCKDKVVHFWCWYYLADLMICYSIVIIIINSSPFLARKKNSPKTCWALTVNAAEQPQPRWLGGVWGNEQPFKVWAKVNLKSYKLSTYGSFSSYATNRPTTVGQTDTDGILREEWWFRPNFQILLPRINFLLTLIFSSLGSKLLIFKRNVCDAIRQPSISDLCKLTYQEGI